MTDYKSMFEQAVRTLAAIDEALGIGGDGCGDPERTLDAIASLKASPISEEAMDILRAENDKLKAEARKVGDRGTVTREMRTLRTASNARVDYLQTMLADKGVRDE